METTNNDIFFRFNEYHSLVETTVNNASKIDVEADKYFENTSNLEHLLFKASILDHLDSTQVFTSINSKIGYIKDGQTTNESPSKDYTILNYFNDITYEIYPVTNTKFFFWLTILYISLIFIYKVSNSKKKIPNFIYWIIIPLLGVNLFNYYIKEPEILADMRANIKYKNYKNSAYRYSGLNALSKFDIPIEERYIYANKTYSYNVTGNDEYNNYVEGEISTNGKNGDGFIIMNGSEINIDVEWIGNGKVEGRDENGNLYNLEVE